MKNPKYNKNLEFDSIGRKLLKPFFWLNKEINKEKSEDIAIGFFIIFIVLVIVGVVIYFEFFEFLF